MLALLIVLVLIAILINSVPVQNWLVGKVTSRISKDLHTEVSIQGVNFSLFNRMYLERTLVRDHNQDTLLWAKTVKLSITDWFFLKDSAALEYIGLEDAMVNMHRTDSIWNYNFLAEYFSSPPSESKKAGIQLILKKVELQNVRVNKLDEWIGQNTIISLNRLNLEADDIDLSKRRIHIHTLDMNEPFFQLVNYDGKRPDSLRPGPSPKPSDGGLQWNPGDWDIAVTRLNLHGGAFSNEKATPDRKPYDYFDPKHILFGEINGRIDSIRFQKDSIFGSIHLSTKERSGFKVNSIVAQMKFFPEGMIFNNLDLRTPQSHLQNYYAMRYHDFDDDMSNFLHQVRLEGRFQASTLSSDDIAYFAPELKDWKKQIIIDGDATGTIDNLSGKNILIEAGKNTILRGDIRMNGLPDINKTFIDFTANDFRTTYADAITIVPALKQIRDPNISRIQRLSFKGTFTGFLRDFVTYGTIQTNLGTVVTDVNMKLPEVGSSTYSGKVSTNNFELGQFLGLADIGKISFNGAVKGSGFSLNNINASLDGYFRQVEFKGYNYKNITAKVSALKKSFQGHVFIDDPQAKGQFDGSLDFNSKVPEIHITADLQRSSFKELNLAKNDLHVIGKFKLDFQGKNIDEFLGEARLFDVAVTRNDETYVFDTLTLDSKIVDGKKFLNLKNSEVTAYVIGEYNLMDLPNAFRQFLHGYYPSYIAAPEKPIRDQNFIIGANFNNIDQYLKLFDDRVKGFNNSTFAGGINTKNNTMSLNAKIPFAAYGKYKVSDFTLYGVGNLDSLRTETSMADIVIGDSLRFPTTKISIASSGGSSSFNIKTSANQTLNSADLSARITTLNDGIRLNFAPSTIVVNDQTWTIEKDGEITLSRSLVDASGVKFTNGEQEIEISSELSSIGNSNDLVVKLKKIHIDDFAPYFVKNPLLEGMVTGEARVEDPLGKFKVDWNIDAEKFRMNGDSIGVVKLTGLWENEKKRATFHAISDNEANQFNIDGLFDGSDSLNQTINATSTLVNTNLHLIEPYLAGLFSEVRGSANGTLSMVGNVKHPDYVGSVKVRNAGMRVLYTRCYYTMDETTVEFKPGVIDFGKIQISDSLHNRGELTGTMKHDNFRNFEFDITATTKRLLVLNTTHQDNSVFYGTAIGKANFMLKGPETDMHMVISGEPVDSSRIFITSGSSKQSGQVDYIVWKEYGREMNTDSLLGKNNVLTIDLDLTANNFAKMNVIMDEVAGDVIRATGYGNLKIHTSTHEDLTMTGRYVIESGNYNFSFQTIFNKPFVLLPNAGSYIRWDGDPYEADIDIRAKYTADHVRMSTLFTNQQGESTINSNASKESSDVDVICHLTGALSKPNIDFNIELPSNSPVRNDPAVINYLKSLDVNETNKQVTYLIVFNTFAPRDQYNTDLYASTLVFNSISEFVSSYLSSSLQTALYGIFKDPNLNVNFNYSRQQTSYSDDISSNAVQITTRNNINLEFIKSVLNNKLVITFGSNFNFADAGTTTATGDVHSFLFLPDVNAEYKITNDGKVRATFFYRSNFDMLYTSGRRDRAGGSISYQTEFDSFVPKKKKKKDTTNVAGTDSKDATKSQGN